MCMSMTRTICLVATPKFILEATYIDKIKTHLVKFNVHRVYIINLYVYLCMYINICINCTLVWIVVDQGPSTLTQWSSLFGIV